MTVGTKEKGSLLFTFTTDDVESLIIATGRSIDKRGFIKDENGKNVRCSCCNRPLHIDTVGRFMPGSIKIICDDLLCLNDYLMKKIV